MYGTLAAYSTVFAYALSERFSIFTPYDNPETDYLVFLAVFAVIVVPLSCMELTEQVYVQLVLSFCRILMVGLMAGTILVAEMKCSGGVFGRQQCVSFSDYDPLLPERAESTVFSTNLDNMYIILPLIGYVS